MDGSVYVYEYAKNEVTQDSGSVYAYEYAREVPVFFNGSVYAYEYPKNYPLPANGNGSIYAYEYALPNTNPGKIWVFDGTQWVRRPDYIWNGTTWTQIL
jgi:hypothetical protein